MSNLVSCSHSQMPDLTVELLDYQNNPNVECVLKYKNFEIYSCVFYEGDWQFNPRDKDSDDLIVYLARGCTWSQNDSPGEYPVLCQLIGSFLSCPTSENLRSVEIEFAGISAKKNYTATEEEKLKKLLGLFPEAK